jgi:hypothetical protein
MHRMVAAMIAAGLLGASGASAAMAADNPTSAADFTGGWRLHPEGSRFLHPQSAPKDLVWAILFEQNRVRWNLVIIPQAGPPTFESFENDLGAAPAPISGSSHVARASVMLGDGSFTTKSLRSLGDIKETSSTCVLADGKKQLRCHGTATKADGSTADFEIAFDRM